ncbi:MAG: M48 family metalloprotease [Candidatus Omnitrophota bacterium]|nr:M48 family metalloprotease [Candidatus Omnitrophota bacterium]MDZ4242073.1 M48 family metalloprotease [Candidatus Omnitrophota bacterium]
MEKQKYDTLIHRLQEFAEKNPGGYKVRVLLLGVLGYAYLLFILLFLAAAIAAGSYFLFQNRHGRGLTFQLLIFVGGLAFIVLRSLWIHTPPPWGYYLKREEAPLLFDMLEDICRRLKCPRPDAVVLDGQFNASIYQIPRLGIFGWYKNTLCLGLPLLAAMSPDEFRSVVAHEFGHLASSHGKAGTWIYRIRESWIRLVETLQHQEHFGSFLFAPFFNWYLPFFNAYSFVLARQHEYQADSFAGDIAGRNAAASALSNLAVQGEYIERVFWPSVYGRVTQSDSPPDNVFSDLDRKLEEKAYQEKEKIYLRQAFNLQTHTSDTHPSLRDRLKALGYQVLDAGSLSDLRIKNVRVCAGEEMLGKESWEKMITEFDRKWKEDMAADWKARHEFVQTKLKEIGELDTKAAGGTLRRQDLWKRALLIYDIQGPEHAAAALRDVLKVAPDHREANFRLGLILSDADDPDCVPLLEKAMAINPFYIFTCCGNLVFFHERRGEYGKAKDYDRKMDEMDSAIAKASDERRYQSGMTIEAHGLSDEKVAYIREQLEGFQDDIDRAYLVKKKVKVFPDQPFVILAVKTYSPWFRYRPGGFQEQVAQRLADQIDFDLDRGMAIVVVEDAKCLGAARKISGSLVFRRGKPGKG